MSRLKVVLRGTVVSEIDLSPDKEYVGGRKEGCDIRLQSEKGISREHFKIKYTDGKWQVVAISRFGDVFSLGQKIEQADLQHGQSFHVPPYDFTFLDVPEVGAAAERPRILDINENTKTIMGAAQQMPYIKIVNSKGEVREMLRLEVGEVWVAGRDLSCQIIIPDQRVSRRQFEIHKVNGAYTILDLASVNGTFLNGTPVSSTDPQTLKSGDSISVLDNVMYFELHDPNFKYKIENIEVPPLQVVQPEPVFVPPSSPDQIESQSQQIPEIEEIEESQVADGEEYVEESDLPVQIESGGGPFTGMPNQGYDQNQFYTFDQGQPGATPGASTQAQVPPTPPPQKKTLLQNRPLLIALVALILGGAYWYTENMMPTEAEAPKVIVNESDPFNRLTPEQQKEVEENYTLAEQMYSQQKYDLALEKIRKIEEILPQGYKDSERIKIESDQANLTIVQKQKDEEAQREREERQARLKQVLDECRKLLTPDATATAMGECLAPVVAIDPNDSEYLRLMSEAEKIESDRAQKAREEKDYEAQVAELKKMFREAEEVQAEGYAFKAIKKYEAVTQSSLPDPGKLKDKSKDRIAFIESKIREKSERSLSEADRFIKEGKLRDAIMTLREATVYDPENTSIKDKIDSYTYELMRQVRILYQESIIDENYGLLESTETKQGAKDKWKKITDMDLTDGEYYRKAIVKLRRYGVM